MNPSLLKQIQIPLTLVMGTKNISLEDFATLKEGSLGVLDTYAGEPATLMAGEKPVALAEVVVIDELFGYRITKMLIETGKEV